MYVTPYESKNQKAAILVHLQWERLEENAVVERDNLINLGIANPKPPQVMKEWGNHRTAGIVLFVCCECILNPLPYSFITLVQATRAWVVIMQNNAPAHIYYNHNHPPCWQLGLRKREWPANCPDHNLIDTIWCEMKDRIKELVWIWVTTAGIRMVMDE